MSTKPIAIVTGGSRGIGLSIARQLIDNGYTVVICSRNPIELNQAVLDLNAKSNNQAVGICIDVSRSVDCKKLIRFSSQISGSIHLLVNNAGIYGPIGRLESNNLREWKKTLEINLMGAVYCSRHVIPAMKAIGSGKIINLAGGGVGGPEAFPNFTAYYTSKIAIVGFTEVLAAELKDYNIQVNCVAPGAVNTHFTNYLISQGTAKAGSKMFQKATNQKATGGDSPKLITKLISFLVSKQAGHITGMLLSAKWDAVQDLKNPQAFTPNKYKLRRINQKVFFEA